MSMTLNPSGISATLKNQRLSATATGVTVSETWLVPSSGVAAFELAYAIDTAHGTYSSAYLQSRNKDPIDGEAGSTAAYLYQLTYNPKPWSVRGGFAGTAGDEVLEGSANALDAPINVHPTLSDVQKAAKSAAGKESYLSPQPVWQHTKYFDRNTFTPTESELVTGVGKIANAGTLSAAGLQNASSGKWLMTERRIRYGGDVVEIIRIWQYAENGWDTDIYEAE